MTHAFVRLFGISTACLFLLFLGLYCFRWLGQSQVHLPMEHPLLGYKSYWVQFPSPQSKNINEAYRFLNSSTWTHNSKQQLKAPGLAIYLTADQHWVVAYRDYGLVNGVQKIAWNQKPLKTWVAEDSDSFISLTRFFEQHPNHQAFFIDIKERDDLHLSKFTQVIRAQKKGRHIFVTSANGKPLRYIHKEEPLWLYSNHQAEWTQFSILVALHLESLASLWADIVIVPASLVSVKNDARAFAELKRRFKKSFLDLRGTHSLPQKSELPHVDGWIVDQPGLASSAFIK